MIYEQKIIIKSYCDYQSSFPIKWSLILIENPIVVNVSKYFTKQTFGKMKNKPIFEDAKTKSKSAGTHSCGTETIQNKRLSQNKYGGYCHGMWFIERQHLSLLSIQRGIDGGCVDLFTGVLSQ